MVYGKYVGNYGSLNPNNASSYGEIATGYEMSAGRIGSTTSSQTANQVSEVMQRLNEGTKTIELVMVSPQILEQVPQEQFREINRLAKLSGMTPTAHAPIVDPAGFGGGGEGQGASWSEATRLEAEKYLLDSARRLIDANPKGNINLTFHASSMPAIDYQMMNNGKEKEVVPMIQHVVNVDDGRVFPIKREEMFKPQEGNEMKITHPNKLIEKYNKLIWDNGMMGLIDNKRVIDAHFPHADVSEEDIKNSYKQEKSNALKGFVEKRQREMGFALRQLEEEGASPEYLAQTQNNMVENYRDELSKRAKIADEAYKEKLEGTLKRRVEEIRGASQYYDKMQTEIESMYNQLQKDVVNRQNELRRIEDEDLRKTKKEEIEKISNVLGTISEQWQKKFPDLKDLEEERKKALSPDRRHEIDYEMFEIKKDLMDRAIPELDELRRISPQRILVPIEEFAREKAAETFANIAFKLNEECEESGKKAPILSIENVMPNMAFSRADQLRELIDESREKFVMKAVDSGMSKEKALETAEKLIGATWDVAHINLIRKEGRSAKESVKEIERQTQVIAPYVKKMHIVDNFGFSDSHIPLGMGNVPVKKIMETMKENEFSGPMISEAVSFAQQFKTSPHMYELEALGAPLNYPGLGGPSMSEARGMYGSSFTGYGTFLPEQHFAMYGGGFSGLPLELGGRVGGGKSSQFSGTPME